MKRKRIVLLLNWRKSWLGGLIYIVNLVNVLNYLDDSEKPEILVFYKPDLEEFTREMDYPYLKTIPWHFPGFLKGYLMSWLTGKNYFVQHMVEHHKPDGIYPLNDWPVNNRFFQKHKVRVVPWFPDLQHKFYPHFFKRTRVYFREQRLRLILRHALDLAVSSQDVKNHFKEFYQLRPALRIHTLRFVTKLPAATYPAREALMKKYRTPSEYFIVSNQFTNHKNHPVILEALRILKERGRIITILMTGKTDFKGNEVYIANIRSKLRAYQLENQIALLGVIPRLDQLALMKYSQAVIQPSFFEGWSTVIEDAKSLSVPVIAASLPVNQEQLGDTGIFFDPNNAAELATILEQFEPDGRHLRYEPYPVRATRFAKDFISIFN